MKSTLNRIGRFVIVFIFALSLSFLCISQLMRIFRLFGLISEYTESISTVVISALITVLLLVYYIHQGRTEKKTKFDNWVLMNFSKMILCYIILIICLASIRKDVFMSFEELRSLISLEWTMFGISAAVFLVWNVIIVEYLEKKKPIEISNRAPIEKAKYIEEKGTFFQIASSSFNTISLLFISLVMLIFATFLTYIVWREINLFNQTIGIIAFFFATNTLLDLMSGVLRPLKEKKHKILESTKISNFEVEEQNRIITQTKNFLKTIEGIDSSNALSDEEKMEIKTRLLAEYMETNKAD